MGAALRVLLLGCASLARDDARVEAPVWPPEPEAAARIAVQLPRELVGEAGMVGIGRIVHLSGESETLVRKVGSAGPQRVTSAVGTGVRPPSFEELLLVIGLPRAGHTDPVLAVIEDRTSTLENLSGPLHYRFLVCETLEVSWVEGCQDCGRQGSNAVCGTLLQQVGQAGACGFERFVCAVERVLAGLKRLAGLICLCSGR